METPDNLFPKQNEGRENFMARCMVNPQMSEGYDKDQRRTVCAAIYDENMPAGGAGDMAAIDLFGIVGLDFTAKEVSAFLQAAGGKDIRVNLFSGGGSLFEGAAIYALLNRYEGNVTVDILGLAASAASFIAMAGDVVRMDVAAQFMIHNAIGEVRGNPRELRESADEIERQQAGMVLAYMKKTGKDRETILGLMDAETWYGAAEALEAGFIDAIFEMDDDRDIAAELPLKLVAQYGYKNVPDSVTVVSQDPDKKQNTFTAATPPGIPNNNTKPKSNDMTDLQAITEKLVAYNPEFNGGKTEGATPETVAAEVSKLTATANRLRADLNAAKNRAEDAESKVDDLNAKLGAANTTARAARVEMEVNAITAEAGVELADEAQKAVKRRVARFLDIDPEGDESDIRADMREDAIRYAQANGIETGESKTIPSGKKKNMQTPKAETPSMQPEVGTEQVVDYEAKLQAKVQKYLQANPDAAFSDAVRAAKSQMQTNGAVA